MVGPHCTVACACEPAHNTVKGAAKRSSGGGAHPVFGEEGEAEHRHILLFGVHPSGPQLHTIDLQQEPAILLGPGVDGTCHLCLRSVRLHELGESGES